MNLNILINDGCLGFLLGSSFQYLLLFFDPIYTTQVCTFGSVPLKTYLPDGDIDVTAFSHDQNLKGTWSNQVRDMLENEEKNQNADEGGSIYSRRSMLFSEFTVYLFLLKQILAFQSSLSFNSLVE